MTILIILTFICVWIIAGNMRRAPDWRLAFVQALILWAAYMILTTEMLSLFSAVTRLGLSIVWAFPTIGFITWGWMWLKRGNVLRLPIIYHYQNWMDAALDIFVIIILIITAVLAFVSPPNSSEVMTSSMARVAHWTQNQSLAHYATGIESQNSAAPGAEIMILNFFIMAKGDGWVNFIAWLGFAGSAAAAVCLAKTFGAGSNGQRLAGVFSVTIPVAIAQASSSMNDLILCLWVVSSVLMIFYYRRVKSRPFYIFLAVLAAALALVTKPIALIYLIPFVLYFYIILLRKIGIVKSLGWLAIALCLVVLLSGGYLLRNQNIYGQFYRPEDLTAETNQLLSWRVLVSNLTRNAVLHADLPLVHAENWLQNNINKLHDQLGLNIEDPSTTFEGSFSIPQVNTSELMSGNPLHALTIVISFVVILGLVIFKKYDWELLVYCGAILIDLLLFCFLLKWRITGSRLQLPLFFMFAPVVGYLFGKIRKYHAGSFVGVLLVAYSLPWLFTVQERPIIPVAGRTYPKSIFTASREELYFATRPDAYPFVRRTVDTLQAESITGIGLDLEPGFMEYPIWALLDAPSKTYRIEYVATQSESMHYLDMDFIPEALICYGCPETQTMYAGFELVDQDDTGAQLYICVK